MPRKKRRHVKREPIKRKEPIYCAGCKRRIMYNDYGLPCKHRDKEGKICDGKMKSENAVSK